MDSTRSAAVLRASYGVAAAVAFAIYGSGALAQQAQEPAAADTGQLEEVVITAQKRTEKLEDVPVSASVVSTDSLASQNVSDIVDLNKLVPSVQLNGTINGRVPMGIRGVSSVSNEQAVGVPSGVAIMVDGVPIPSDSYDGNDLEDIQSVEVLKGPQATLGGRTAAAGVINIITRGPTDTLQGNITVTGTTDGEARANGYISGPLTDRVEGSLSAYQAFRDYPITNVYYGTKTTERDDGFRGKLKVAITDDFDATFMAHYGETYSNGFNFVWLYIAPGSKLLGGIPQSTALPSITPSWQNLNIDSIVNYAGASHVENDYSVDLNWRLGGGYTLSSTTESQQEREYIVQDLFGDAVNNWATLFGLPAGSPNPPGLNDSQSQNIDVRQISEELKLVSPDNQPFSYVLGAFYSDTKVDLIEHRQFPAPPPGPGQTAAVPTAFYGGTCLVGPTSNAFCQRVTPDTATYDLYGRSTWKFAPSTSLVTGLRYNYDQLSYKWYQLIQSQQGPWSSFGSNSSSTVVGDISLQQQFAPGWMGYATYARGYSPAVYDTGATLTSNATQQPVGKETINHYEIGSKGTYLDNRMTLNVSLFDTEYIDYQIEYYLNNGTLTPPLVLSSAGGARTRGVELDTALQATPETKLGFNAAYTDAIFTKFKGASCWLGEGCPIVNGTPQQDLSGTTMPNSPKFKFVLSGEQRIPLGQSSLEMVLGGDYSYRTSAQMLPDGNPQAIQGAFGILDLNLGLRPSSQGHWSVTAFVNNVTNKIYYTDVEDFLSGAWGGNAIVGQPARGARRYGGLRLSASL